MGKIISASSIMNTFREYITLGKDGPAYADRIMSKYRFRFLAVQDDQKVFKGYIRQKDVKRLIEEEEEDNDLEKIIMDIPKVSPDTHVTDLRPLFIDQTYPLVVIDEKGRSLGFLNHSNVVSMVTGYSNGEVKEMIDEARQ